MFAGGIASKLGNVYEAKWLVRQCLEVLAGHAEWIRFEGIVPEFAGFEFAIRKSNCTEWHQTKINSTGGNWTINALDREGVLKAFRARFLSNKVDRCVFVSEDPARSLLNLAGKAATANTLEEFTPALSQDQREDFKRLIEGWSADEGTSFRWLKRTEVRVLPEKEIDDAIAALSNLYFIGDGAAAFPPLRQYLEARFNKTLTTEQLRSELPVETPLRLKDWSLLPTLRQRLQAETSHYLETYEPFGFRAAKLPRPEADELVRLAMAEDGPIVLLLTGIAGCGKSGVIRAFLEALNRAGCLHLAFRVDHHLAPTTPAQLGQELLERAESPVVTLKGLSQDECSVLIVDQLDAVSEISGRNGAVRNAVLRMVAEARQLGTVRLLLVCRSFDLDSDPRLKQLQQEHRVKRIDLQLTAWEEVEKYLSARGVDSSRFSVQQKELLRTPINLVIYLEVAEENLSFNSRNDLFVALIRRKERALRNGRSLPWSIWEPLYALASWMSERQRLDAPASVLDPYPGAADLLASEALISVSRGQVNFFHESLFDYVYARGFAKKSTLVHALLLSAEQHLFRRTQLRQIFESLRQDDPARYARELQVVLQARDVRYHVKAAVARWLGQLAEPTATEVDIVLQLDDREKPFSQIVSQALFGTAGWFDQLNRKGWLKQQLETEQADRRQSVLWWLSSVAAQRGDQTVQLLEGWWRGDPSRADDLLGWFAHTRHYGASAPLAQFCERIIRSRPPGLAASGAISRQEMLLATWSEGESFNGAGVLRALFDAWFESHPGHHPFESSERSGLDQHQLTEIATKSPRTFVEGSAGALVRAVRIVRQRNAEGSHDWTFSHRTFDRYRVGANLFLGNFTAALKNLAGSDPPAAVHILQQLDPSEHDALLQIHLDTVAANGAALAKHLLTLLSQPELLRAGLNGAEWKSFADAAAAAIPHLSESERALVEAATTVRQPELDFAKEMLRRSHSGGDEAAQQRSRAIYYVSRSGYVLWCILETIGPDKLSDATKHRLDELRRKFGNERLPEPHQIKSGFVESPIARAHAAKMSDASWLEAMAHYSNSWRSSRLQIFTGGAEQLGLELQHLTKLQPSRFVALLSRIPETANPTYISHILWGLHEAESVELESLATAVLRTHDWPDRPFGADIARILTKYPGLAENPGVLDALLWYVEHGEANDAEEEDSSNVERETLSIENLLSDAGRVHVRGISGARGAAAEAFASVLWNVPGIANEAWAVVERRIEKESLVSVRACLVAALVPLFNVDRQRCSALFERLVLAIPDQNPNRLAPLQTSQGHYLLQFVLHQVPEIGRRLLKMMLDSPREQTRLIGAWHVFRSSFHDQSYATQADTLAMKGEAYRRLAACVATDAITQDEFRHKAAAQLIAYFDDESEQVRKDAADAFRKIPADDFERFSALAEAFLTSKAFQGSSYFFFMALKSATCDVRELVVKGAELTLRGLDRKAAHARISDLHYLHELLKREYAASEDSVDLRRRILDIIDQMLMEGIYGAEDIVKAYDRQ
jgi:hypothetical protein